MPRAERIATADRLNRDWADLQLLPVSPSWCVAQPGLAYCRDLGELLGAVGTDPDGVLSALIRLAKQGEQLAGRIAVQAMLPKLIRLALRDRRATFDDYLAAFWLCLLEYPIQRRGQRIAANLAWETRRLALSESAAPAMIPLPELPEWSAPEAAGELTLGGLFAAASANGLLDETNRAVLTSVYEEGLSSAEAARRHQTSAEAVRWRCSNSVRRLRRHRELLLQECGS